MNDRATKVEKRKADLVQEVQSDIIDLAGQIRSLAVTIQKDFNILRQVQLLSQGIELDQPTLF